MNVTAIQTTVLPKTPYRGLRPYRFADQAIFFARDAEKRALFRKVVVYRGVLLYGDQGSGKSSLINAGLLPMAMEEGMAPERIRVQPKVGQEIVIERVRTSDEPGAPFLPSLFDSGTSGVSQLGLSVDEFEARLEEAEGGPAPLLIFDQFEEWVTLAEEAQRNTHSDEPAQAQQRILDMVVRLLRAREQSFHLLFVFREDFLARLNRLFVLCPELTNQYIYVTSPPASALLDIIQGPFRSAQLPEGHFRHELSQALCIRIATAFEEQNAGGRINLAEVQIVCLRLWNSADAEGEFARRGISGLLEDFLSDSLKTIDARLQPAALAMLARLVTSSGTRNVVSEEDLLAWARKDRPLAEKLYRDALDKLVLETGIVRRERRNQSYTFEIVSEFLVPWIYRYRLKSQAAIERRKWIIRGAVFVYIVLIVGAAVSYWVVTQNSEKALRNRYVMLAEAARQQAEASRNQADKLSQQLKALLDNGKGVDPRIREAADTITKLTVERDKLQIEAAQLRKEVSLQSSRADEAVKQRGEVSAAAAQLPEATKKLADYEQRINSLTGQVKDLQAQLENAKKAPAVTPAQQPQTPIMATAPPDIAVNWKIIPEDEVKQRFGGKFATTFVEYEVRLSNRSNQSVAAYIPYFQGYVQGRGVSLMPVSTIELAAYSSRAAQLSHGSWFFIGSETSETAVFFLKNGRVINDGDDPVPHVEVSSLALMPLKITPPAQPSVPQGKPGAPQPIQNLQVQVK